MTTSNKSNKSDADAASDALAEMRVAFIAAGTPAQGARVMGVNGKWLRDILRNTLHIHVSRGGDYGEATRALLFDAAVARIAKRTATVATTDASDATE